MADWRRAAKAGDWLAIRWELLSGPEQVELLALLRRALPVRCRVDGYEAVERHDTPEEAAHQAADEVSRLGLTGSEADRFHQNAIEGALMLSSLEAIHGGETDWTEQVEAYGRQIQDELAQENGQRPGNEASALPKAHADPPATADPLPAPEMSREAHLERALEHVAEYRSMLRLAATETSDADDAEWLMLMIKDAAAAGYWAGRRIQAAWGKPIEREALAMAPKARKFDRVIDANRRATSERSEAASRRAAEAMRHMHRLITDEGHSVLSAAREVQAEVTRHGSRRLPPGFSIPNLQKRYRAWVVDQ